MSNILAELCKMSCSICDSCEEGRLRERNRAGAVSTFNCPPAPACYLGSRIDLDCRYKHQPSPGLAKYSRTSTKSQLEPTCKELGRRFRIQR